MNSQLSKNNEHAASGGAGSWVPPLCPTSTKKFIYFPLNGLAQALTIAVTLRANTEQGDPELKPAFLGTDKNSNQTNCNCDANPICDPSQGMNYSPDFQCWIPI